MRTRGHAWSVVVILRVLALAPAASQPVSFSSVSTDLDGTNKYIGGVAYGGLVYFAPATQNNVGVFNPATGLFNTIPTTGVYGSNKYAGATVVGSRIYFAPLNEPNVGVVDTSTSTFSTIRIRSDQNPYASYSEKYWGAATVGQKVYFAPFALNDVGVLDTQTEQFSTIATGLTGSSHYWGANAVVRLPSNSNHA